MSAIAQRRVAGATALMILLYLLQVALFAQPVGAEVTGPIATDPSTGTTFPSGGSGNTCPENEDGWSDHIGVSQGVSDSAWGSAQGTGTSVDVTLTTPQYSAIVCVKQGNDRQFYLVTYEEDSEGDPVTQSVAYDPTAPGATAPAGLSHWAIKIFENPTAGLTVVKDVEIVSGSPSTTSFGFEVTGQTDFSLGDGEDESFAYDVSNGAVTVTVTEKAITEPGWSTSVSCTNEESGSTSVTFDLNENDDVTCTFTNTYRATTNTTITTTETTAATTTTQPEDEDEVLGTTVTTTPDEVSADTLPFTGFESGDTVKLGLLALLAGALMLFAVRGPKEEEGTATEIGGWSSL